MELVDPEKISAVQQLYLDCFLHILAQNRSEKEAAKIFAKLTEFLTDMRQYMHDRLEAMTSEMSALVSQDIKYSQMSAAVFSLPENYVNQLGNELSELHL